MKLKYLKNISLMNARSVLYAANFFALQIFLILNYKWDKVFKSVTSKTCGRQP